MKQIPKQIPHPELKSAEKLTPLQLNALKYDNRHTVLTPERMEKIQLSQTKVEG